MTIIAALGVLYAFITVGAFACFYVGACAEARFQAAQRGRK